MLISRTTSICLYIVATNALTFKKRAIVAETHSLLAGILWLKSFEQTDLYQSVLKMQQNKFLFQWDLQVVVGILCSLMVMDRIFCLGRHINNLIIIMYLSAGGLWWLVLPSGFVSLVDNFEIIWINYESWKWFMR